MNTSGNVIFDYEVTGSAAASINCGSPFLGDSDGWYTIIARHVYDTSTSTLNLTFNADTTAANYGYRGITANNTTVANINSTSSTIRLCSVASGTTTGLSFLVLYAKQGSVRLMNGYNVCDINGTTVTQLEVIGSVWNNTNTQITNMVFTPSAGNIGVGGRVIVLRGNALAVNSSPSQVGAWKRVGSTVLGGAASSVTFSGLNGDTAVCYYLSSSIKVTGNCTAYILPNNDGTAGNFGYQYLYSDGTTVGAGRSATTPGFWFGYGSANTRIFLANAIIFAKTGFLRPAILQSASDINATSVGNGWMFGQSFTDTATNITSLVVKASANNFDTGSQFDLYALYS
jgi:hypothetical protein